MKHLKVRIYYQNGNKECHKSWIRKIVKRVIRDHHLNPENQFLSIIFIDNKRIQELNQQFFHRNGPTDVIAFPIHDSEDKIWGEIYISTEQALIQSRHYQVSFKNETARLIIHGLLHLLGYKDYDRDKRKKMTTLENKYLK